jgi:hypothetical protein
MNQWPCHLEERLADAPSGRVNPALIAPLPPWPHPGFRFRIDLDPYLETQDFQEVAQLATDSLDGSTPEVLGKPTGPQQKLFLDKRVR